MPTGSSIPTGRVSNVARIGLRVLDLDAGTVSLHNRTNHTTYKLSPEGIERWRKYLMAFKFRGKSKKKGTSLRLTGMFKTKRRGLFVGSVSELGEMKDKLKAALAEEKGLVFFLWRNEDTEEGGPAYTLSMDVSQEDDRPKKSYGKPKRKPVEDDEDQDEEAEEKDDDDEVPF
jgi:hypothetical protein